MALNKVEKFSLYLFKEYKISSILKIQKILFFLFFYEKKKEIENGKKEIEESPIF